MTCHHSQYIFILFFSTSVLVSVKSNAGITIPVVSGVPLESLVLKSFENWRGVMKKGNAANGIPFLDPFLIPFDIPLKFPHPVSPSLGSFELILSKLAFAGLSTFKVQNLQIDPVSRDMTFENYIGNMSATSNYDLKYYPTNYFPIQAPISEGSAYGAIYGADIKGTGTVLPLPGNWFKLANIRMTFSFENLDLRIYPKIPLADSTLQKSVQDSVYNEIQRQKPNMSNLATATYSKTVELKLSK